ncbi:sialate O-acetylesterase [Roseburia sp. CAG:380]|uniref:sialate O-acetylesterase n=1 Tax=Roseburia sp. AM59-24XD TaxID=2293138 RepID=UPI00033C8550|nr:sialate O-acetylesterase [Roseburia sp. AM59-24XD]RHP89008.1 sialate O-acetylesterase [Roseburia sp. AM59-24XD]CDC93312.1 sialate O-acetylesterase [Roseburia sp. CAG:380]
MLKLPAIFSDHMILQRRKPVVIWGESDARKVTVTIQDARVVTYVQDGKWQLFLPPMEAGGPYVLTVKTDNDEVKTYEDVMYGEIWLAGGQSNMELELQNSKDGAVAVSEAHNELLRFYYTPKVSYLCDELYEQEEKSCWELCCPENVGRWSAVGYYFARKLAAQLDVPVGIIGCNWGGTSASCWMSREALESDKVISSYVEEYDEIVANQDFDAYCKEREEYIVYQAEFDKNCKHYYETTPNPTWEGALEVCGENKYPGPMGPRSEYRPAGLYETMIQRIAPYTLAGFLYYQGEEDDKKPRSYYNLLSRLIRQWREDWHDDKLPFMIVQLPMFSNVGEENLTNWPLIREAQHRVYRTVKNTGLAVVLDKGEYSNIHPIDKQPVGERLALQAMYHAYGLDNEVRAFGPFYQSCYTLQSYIWLIFNHVRDGIICTGEKPLGFEVAGQDKVFYPADSVQIQGNRVRLFSANVKEPVYARYNWRNYAEVNMFGKNGLPMAPFRTSMNDEQ